jgi:hypothetical protein
MAEDFLRGSFTGTTLVLPDRSVGREAVKMLLLGKPEGVQQTIYDLYTCRFCEPGVWSKPLVLTDLREVVDRTPGEVLRIYKRYLTR